ncbi:DUF1048 domain-containing protein [Enterococcus dongliensis]|uniref:DUF1048 domain-containing protein n=1 Tax=Enterococcus dongliensis TaxID=2559925 RepID=A0AAP5NID9_9ENTE|nr:DUF1048 domain-containing protein [Enterococcus dongliensis]MDT2595508.1 DUF1048 domain-containing protein [Enterococcus dongliensis]MDT2603277.1 DUF1048 domain-containing protein [Enterococcus dongliensis]MDT2612750.1 DUF1048 domain-containing protein [Enterococcus dongliensis]MDT2633639.1 DUF1048 domain-containing protein [Enterococcus dongliensis]MDT2635987.1 DUF1048 domain-containing protein [Enterococcus dongliensis]
MKWYKKMRNEKKRYKDYLKAKEELPKEYGQALTALDHYMMNFVGSGDFMGIFEDLLQLFADGAAEGRSISELVGNDPVKFADEIMAEYPEVLWYSKTRKKLKNEFERIEDK